MNYKLIAASTLLAMQATIAFGAAEPLPEAGLTPDSPFYFTKTWKEQIQSFLTFGSENKAKQFLHLAEVRLAEYKKMAEAGKDELSQRTMDKFNAHLERALDKISDVKKEKKAKKEVKDLEARVQSVRLNHLDVLRANLARVPEQARKGLERAIENAQRDLDVDLAEKDLEFESEDPEGDEFVFRLLEGNASGMSAVAMLEAVGTKTKVKVRLVGATLGVAQPAHIHVGACPNVGAVKYALTNLMDGRSETILDVSIDTLKTELPLGLNVHKSAAEAGVYVACGDLAF